MKKIIYLIPAFICLSVSCQKNNDLQTGDLNLSQEKLVEFSFRTGPDQEGEQTRTHLDADGKTVIWQAGDKISRYKDVEVPVTSFLHRKTALPLSSREQSVNQMLLQKNFMPYTLTMRRQSSPEE